MSLRVVLADDHTLVRAGIRALVEEIPEAAVVAEADNGRQAVEAARQNRPDIVIMDISMSELNGIDATARIRAELPATRVLILSMHPTGDFVRGALKAGASGYLVKDSAPLELRMALEAIMRGEVYLSSRVSREFVQDALAPTRETGEPSLDSLSTRQREVLQLIAEGRSLKQIAFTLHLSVKTVESHKAALMARLGIRDVAGLVLYAVRHKLVAVGRPE